MISYNGKIFKYKIPYDWQRGDEESGRNKQIKAFLIENGAKIADGFEFRLNDTSTFVLEGTFEVNGDFEFLGGYFFFFGNFFFLCGFFFFLYFCCMGNFYSEGGFYAYRNFICRDFYSSKEISFEGRADLDYIFHSEIPLNIEGDFLVEKKVWRDDFGDIIDHGVIKLILKERNNEKTE